MKKSFSLLEFIFVISLLAIISSIAISKNNISNLDLAVNKLMLYLNFTRYIAFIDNKYDPNNPFWYKKLWTIKFKNCNKNIGGIYYSIFSDTNEGGRINKLETLQDPINNKYLYSNGCKEDMINDKSKYILLTKEFDIVSVKLSCYKGNGLGYLSFGSNGKVFSKLGNKPKILSDPCIITIKNKSQISKQIIIEPNGYTHIKE